MFDKLVSIEGTRMPLHWERQLQDFAREVVIHPDTPTDNSEIIRRIGDADAVLLSYTSSIDREVLEACGNIRYIGMCCSLYAPENANVDILTAEKMGIQVRGVRDYGDNGVAEFVVSELVRLLHGFGPHRWKDTPMELTGQKVGVLGMGTTGQIVSGALQYFGADISYYSRTRKPEIEQQKGYRYLPLDQVLRQCDILCTCLTKNVVLLGEQEFEAFGDGKILVNISISHSFEPQAARSWLARPGNFLIGDTTFAVGGDDGGLTGLPNVIHVDQSAGMTSLAAERLGEKVIQNIRDFLGQ